MYLCVLCGSENKQRLFPYTALINLFSEPGRNVFTAQYVQTPRLMCSGDALDDRMYQFDFKGQSCRPGLPLPHFISSRCMHVVSSAWNIKLVTGRRCGEAQVRHNCTLRTAFGLSYARESVNKNCCLIFGIKFPYSQYDP